MRISEINSNSDERNAQKLMDIAKYAHTIEFQRKLDASKRTLEKFFEMTNNPAISCGGGKDGTAIALLAKLIGADVPYLMANPPNPLPDRQTHNEQLIKWLGGKWHIIDYDWNVDNVLTGKERYPDALKIKRLSDFQQEKKFDGIVLGIRSAEAEYRAINLAMRGEIYQAKIGWRCQPIARWRAEDSLCLALLMDAPINPVYVKMNGCGGMEQLHDGTWWPHGKNDRLGWMRRYYPDYADMYEKALLVKRCAFKRCIY